MIAKKRIAFNVVSSRQGGGQVYLNNILRYAKNFPDLQIYIFSPPEFAKLYTFPGIEVVPCKFPAKSILHRVIWEKMFLPSLLKKKKIELVFCPGGNISFLPPRNCRSAITFQNMLIADKESRKRYKFSYMRLRLKLLERLTKKSFREADLVIFISNYAKEMTDKWLLKRKGKSVIIPHGLDGEFRTLDAPPKIRPDFLPEGEYLLYVSNIDVYKSQLEVIEAYYQLGKKRRTDEKLLLIGAEYPPYAKQVKKEIKKLGLTDKVIILNDIPHKSMPAIYQHAKANIFASVCENCPNVVLESLASGKPLFLSKVPPMPEFAKDSAIYFNPDNPNELTDLLLKYLDDKEASRKMGKRATETSLQYRWDETATKIFQAFRDIFKAAAR